MRSPSGVQRCSAVHLLELLRCFVLFCFLLQHLISERNHLKVFLLKNIMVWGWAGRDYDEISAGAMGLALLGSTRRPWAWRRPPLAGRSRGHCPSTCWCPLTAVPWALWATAWPICTAARRPPSSCRAKSRTLELTWPARGCAPSTLTPFSPGQPAFPSPI